MYLVKVETPSETFYQSKKGIKDTPLRLTKNINEALTYNKKSGADSGAKKFNLDLKAEISAHIRWRSSNVFENFKFPQEILEYNFEFFVVEAEIHEIQMFKI